MHISDSDLRVRDLWDDGKWNLQRLATMLSQHLQNKISHIIILFFSRCSDW